MPPAHDPEVDQMRPPATHDRNSWSLWAELLMAGALVALVVACAVEISR